MNYASSMPENPAGRADEVTPKPPGIASRLKLRLKPTPRDRWWLLALAVFIVAALLGGKSLQRAYLIHLLLRANAPSPDVLSTVVKQSRNPESILLRFWHTERIPDRHFVLTYLGRIVDGQTKLSPDMQSLAAQATHDPDIAARELAFDLLRRIRYPQLRLLALEQLADADPAARVLGLESLRGVATSNDVPIAMRLLGDPDPRVVVQAALVLRQATGLDFGIKSSSLAMPRFTRFVAESGDSTDLQADWNTNAIAQGAQRWRDWWKEHQAGYSVSLAPPPMPIQPARLTTSDFRLNDAEGKPVRLSSYRGKVVLLAFWRLDSPFSLSDAPTLDALQRRHPQTVAVLGINVPPEKDDDDMPDMPGMKMPPPPDAAQTRALIQKLARAEQIRYPLLLDPDGSIGLQFDVEDLPTYVLIDAQGRIVRRFVGSRTAPVLAAMIKDVAATAASRANALGKL